MRARPDLEQSLVSVLLTSETKEASAAGAGDIAAVHLTSGDGRPPDGSRALPALYPALPAGHGGPAPS